MLFYEIGRNICAWEVEGLETWYSGFSGFLITAPDCEISWDSENGQGFVESAFIDHNFWLELTVKSSLSVLEEIISNQILFWMGS